MKSNHKNRTVEALMYLDQTMNELRTNKELMRKNTNFAVLLQAGVYALFAHNDPLTGIWAWLPLCMCVCICIVGIRILWLNNEAIYKCRLREKTIQRKASLRLIQGISKRKDVCREWKFFAVYSLLIVATGLALSGLLEFLPANPQPGVQ